MTVEQPVTAAPPKAWSKPLPVVGGKLPAPKPLVKPAPRPAPVVVRAPVVVVPAAPAAQSAPEAAPKPEASEDKKNETEAEKKAPKPEDDGWTTIPVKLRPVRDRNGRKIYPPRTPSAPQIPTNGTTTPASANASATASGTSTPLASPPGPPALDRRLAGSRLASLGWHKSRDADRVSIISSLKTHFNLLRVRSTWEHEGYGLRLIEQHVTDTNKGECYIVNMEYEYIFLFASDLGVAVERLMEEEKGAAEGVKLKRSGPVRGRVPEGVESAEKTRWNGKMRVPVIERGEYEREGEDMMGEFPQLGSWLGGVVKEEEALVKEALVKE